MIRAHPMWDYRKGIAGACVVAAAVVSGMAISMGTYQGLLTLLLCAMAGLAALSLQAKLPFLGFAALMIAAVLFPIEFGQSSATGLSAALPITAFICGTWLLGIIVRQKRSDLDSSRVVIALASFMAVALIAFAAGQFPWFPSPGAPLRAQLAGLGLFLLSGGLFLAAGHQIRHPLHLRRLTWLFLVTGGFFCVTQTVPGLGVAALWSNPGSIGSLFWTWLVAISLSQALLNRNLSGLSRAILLCLCAAALFRGLFLATSWVSGWLPPLVAAGVILLLRFPRTTIGLGMLALPAGFYLAGQALGLLMMNEQYSWITRLEAWGVLWQLFQKSPLLGLGPANYYYYTLLYPVLGWHVRFSSHNNYLDILVQVGFLGLLAFFWFVFEITRLILRLRYQVPPGFARAYVIGALGGLAGTLVSGMLADWIIPFAYNVGLRGFRSSFLFWFFLGGVLALERMTARQAEVEIQIPLSADGLQTNP